MTKPIDPGHGKTRAEAKALRLKAWKRPTKKADRDKLRQERIAEARGYANADILSV